MGFSRQEYWSEVPLPSPVMYVVLSYLCLLLHSVFWKVPGGKEPGTSMAYFVYFLSFRDHSFMLPIVTSLESGLFPVIFVQFYNCFWQESKCLWRKNGETSRGLDKLSKHNARWTLSEGKFGQAFGKS